MAKNIFSYKKPKTVSIPKLKKVSLKPFKVSKGMKITRPKSPSTKLGGMRNKFGITLRK